MRKLLLFVIVALFAIQGRADNVTFTVSDGIDNAGIKSKIESEVSRMLTEINAAQEAGRSLNFSAMGNIGTRVQQSMAMLWENSPFVCTDEEIIEHCLTTGTGYQVRNIPLMMKPTGERDFGEDEYQEAVISFDKQGNVESFYLSISMNLYMNVIKSNLELTDLRRRQLILDYVEQFRTAYNQKDIKFLNQVFSDDALIITGKVITTKHAEGFTSQKIQYNKQSKEQYIKNLSIPISTVSLFYKAGPVVVTTMMVISSSSGISPTKMLLKSTFAPGSPTRLVAKPCQRMRCLV